MRTPKPVPDELVGAATALRARVAHNVRRIAKQRGLPLVRVCAAADVTRSAMYRALTGDASMTLATIARLARALEVDPAELFATTEPAPPGPVVAPE